MTSDGTAAQDKGWQASLLEKGLQCPVCIDFFSEPLTLNCGHTFCRLCLLQSTRLAPDGRNCPECRAVVDIKDPASHPSNAELETAVKQIVPAADVAERAKADAQALEEFLKMQRSQLPVFYMQGIASQPGQSVRLHFFEPRYRVLIRNCWEGNRRFLCTQRQPYEGGAALVVQVDNASFLPDGRANIQGRGVMKVTLTKVWVGEGTGGLYYAETDGSATSEAATTEPSSRRSSRAGGEARGEARAKLILRAAVQAGAPEYNRGNIRRCAMLYSAAAQEALQELEAAMSNQAMIERLRRGVREAEARIRQDDADGAAWALRHSFDAVLDMVIRPTGSQPSRAHGEEVELELPVFYMRTAPDPGALVRIRFFEPRYRVLARDTWQSSERLFVYAAGQPQDGCTATAMHLNSCSWDSDGNANIQATAVASVQLRSVRRAEDAGGLFYASCSVPVDAVPGESAMKACCCTLQ
eukprot:TRINITY_DN76455_c0_g1_i1.p1 TRINITY_DN76455_c0_g1~~TRINITY_DN76455_c0_g1_i1.p1  ORF type:complete len:469 (-),score=114.22 TRINITY_DN76455_c0_g1_i1:45-1451(-)